MTDHQDVLEPAKTDTRLREILSSWHRRRRYRGLERRVEGNAESAGVRSISQIVIKVFALHGPAGCDFPFGARTYGPACSDARTGGKIVLWSRVVELSVGLDVGILF
jgi:hypothetical protein